MWNHPFIPKEEETEEEILGQSRDSINNVLDKIGTIKQKIYSNKKINNNNNINNNLIDNSIDNDNIIDNNKIKSIK